MCYDNCESEYNKECTGSRASSNISIEYFLFVIEICIDFSQN